jgi:hypothetical protein
MEKHARLAQLLGEEGLIGPEGLHMPEPASFALLAAVHEPGYVRQVVDAGAVSLTLTCLHLGRPKPLTGMMFREADFV